MKRKLFNLAAVVSLLLCVAAALLWVRSYYVPDTVTWSGTKGQLREIALLPGQLRIATAPWGGARLQHLTTYDRNRHVVFSRRSLFAGNKTVLGLGFHANTEEVLSGLSGPRPTDVQGFGPTRPLRVRLVTIRFPLLFALFSLVPLFVLARRLPLRVRGGHCPTCGYDLRATPGRCPECGMVSDVKVKAT